MTALIELMKTCEYHAISITDITRKAGVSRMTYYRNYTSKEDILNSYMDEIAERIRSKLQEPRSSRSLYRYYLTLFESLGRESDIGVAALRANLGELILYHINRRIDPPKTPAPASKYRQLFYAGAFYNIFMEWLRGGMAESCEEMAQCCCDIILGRQA